MSAPLYRGRSHSLPAPLGSISGKARARVRRHRFVRLLLALALAALLAVLLLAPPARLRRLVRRALHWYLRELHTRPFSARALSAGVIFFVADVAAQRLGGAGDPFSGARLARYSAYGALVMGPFLHAWYGLMNAYGPGDDLAGSLQKCVFEQLTLEPLCIVLYIVYDGVVCARGWRPTVRKIETMFLPLWFKNAIFWVPANFFNYYIGTPDLRVVFANLCSLFWNAYFSTKINKIGLAAAHPSTGSAQLQGSAKYKLVSNGDNKV